MWATVEGPVGLYGWVVLAPYDATPPRDRDIVKIGTRSFAVIFCAQYSYKLEVLLEERQ